MVPDREPSTFFAADQDLVLFDKFPNVLEANWSFVQFDTVMFGERIDQIRCSHRLPHPVFPTAALDQIMEQKRNHIVRLNESSIAIHNSKSIRISIGCNPNVGPHGFHLASQILEQMIVGFGCMSAEEHVAM